MKRIAAALLATTALATPALADALLDEARDYFQPLPSTVPAQVDNPITDEKIELGKMLYFDPRLSASGCSAATAATT